MRRDVSVVHAHGLALLVGAREGLRVYRDQVVLSRSDAAFTPVLAAAMRIPGFTEPSELSFLYHVARLTSTRGCTVEIGSYLGRSTVVLAHAARASGGVPVAAVDPHTADLTFRQSEYTATADQFAANVKAAGVEDYVTLVRKTSAEAAASWSGASIGLLFIDGSHTREAVLEDVRVWSPSLAPDACVVLDDYLVFEQVRSAVRELRGGNELPGYAVVVGKMIAFGPREIIRSVPRPPAARLLAAAGDKSIEAFNRFFRDRRST